MQDVKAQDTQELDTRAKDPLATDPRATDPRKRNDRILIAAFLVIAILISAVYFVRQAMAPRTGLRVLVEQAGNEIGTYSLDKDLTLTITNDAGGTNTLHIEKGQAWVTDASCPDKICEHTGKISLEGSAIVCLPNRLVVYVTE